MRRLLLVALLLAASGCGEGSTLAPVRGVVLLDGKPLPRVTVCFVHAGSPRWSYGVTDDAGRFSLTTLAESDGAYLGRNDVTISQPAGAIASPPPAVPNPEDYFKQLGESEAAKQTEPIVPRHYQQLDTSGLVIDVAAGGNNVELKLKSGGEK